MPKKAPSRGSVVSRGKQLASSGKSSPGLVNRAQIANLKARGRAAARSRRIGRSGA